MGLGEVCGHGSLKRQCNVCELEAERDALKARLESEKKESAYWRDTEAKILARDCIQYREDRDRWRELAGKLANVFREMKELSFFDKAEGPELRAQNAALHRSATLGLAAYDEAVKEK